MSISAFFRTQCEPEATFEQRVFDVLFGLVAPVLCLAFDPIVFAKDAFWGPAILGSFRFIGYGGIALGWISLAIALWRPSRSVLLAGSLLGTALLAALIGLVLLPFSILGIAVAGFGLLGFLPFLTSAVLFRNALRVLTRKSAGSQSPRAPLLATGIGVALLSLLFVGQFSLSTFVERRIDQILTGDKDSAARAARQLQWVVSVANFDGLVYGYEDVKSPEERTQISFVYSELTGESINERLRQLRD